LGRNWANLMATFRQILVLVIVIGVLGALLYPVFAQPKIHDHDRSNANYFFIGSALIYYAADHDDVLPPVTSEPTLRALLHPYVRNARVFQAGKKSGITQFNFKLAGASLQSVNSLDNAILAYARNPKERDEYFVNYLSTKRGTLTASQLLTALEPQFDRKGVKLFPPDYLADQDPLKEKNEK